MSNAAGHPASPPDSAADASPSSTPRPTSPGGPNPQRPLTDLDLTWDLPPEAIVRPPPTVPADNGSAETPTATALPGPLPPTVAPPAVSPSTLPPRANLDATLDVIPSSPAEMTSVRDTASLPQTIGPYRIVEKLGEGGMGVVYKAEQTAPVRRIVALKVIKIGMDTQEVVARFEAERQALALMDHPNVARVFDAGMTETGRPWFAMEYVTGEPLVSFCDEHRLTVRQRLELFVLVCLAVQHAHQKGIIHRDLKPSNILVSQVDGKPLPKVIDFGIAKATTDPLTGSDLRTAVGALVGTPEYASPEQAGSGGLDVDTRTDVYSLGVVLYQLLTGTLPLDARTLRRDGPEGIARILREVEPPSPSSRLSQLRKERRAAEANRDVPPSAAPTQPVPGSSSAGMTTYLAVAAARQSDPRAYSREIRGDLDWITLKAMEKDRQRRYDTALDLAADIRRYLADEPILARPPSTRYRVAKFVHKYRAPVAAVGAMVLLLVAGVVGTTTGLFRALAARSDAEIARIAADQARQRADTERQRTADALTALRAAEAQADQETRRSIVAGMDSAERLIEARSPDAARLADLASRTAAAALGPDDLLTLESTAIHGRALLAAGRPEEAEPLLRSVVSRLPASAGGNQPTTLPATTPAGDARRFVRGRPWADLADAVRQRGDAAEAVLLYRQALAAFVAEDDRSKARLDVGERLAELLLSLDRPAEAADAYRATLADHTRQLGRSHRRTRAVIDRLATVLISTGRHADALPLVEEQLSLTKKEQPGVSEELASRLTDHADLLVRLGRRKEGQTSWEQAVAAHRSLRPGADGVVHLMWRRLALRSGLGVRPWAGQALRGNAWMIADQSLARAPSSRFAVDEVQWDQGTYRLYHWNVADPSTQPAATPEGTDAPLPVIPPPISHGSLQSLSELPDPPPGLYYLALNVPRTGNEPVRGGAWVLVAPWDVRLFQPAEFNPNTRTQQLWAAMNGAPAARISVPTLLMLDDANEGDRLFGVRIGQGPNGRINDFGVDGTTELALPPGPYRLALSSDDGARVHVDGQTQINAWRARALQTDAVPLRLDGTRHRFRVEYFQGVGEYILRFAPEPMSPRADALVASAVGDDSQEFRRWMLRQGREWERLSEWEQAASYYVRAVRLAPRLPTTDNDVHFQAMRGLVRAMTRLGRAGEAADELQAVADAAPESSEVLAETLLMAARLRLLGGERERSAELASLAHAAADRVSRFDRGRARDLARDAVLIRLGAPLVTADGGLPTQFFCALDETMLEDRSLADALRNVTPADVGWALYRWRNRAESLIAEGRLNEPPPPLTSEPGLYLLQLRLTLADGSEYRAAHWLLGAAWDSAAYTPDGEGMFDRQQYPALTHPLRRPAGRADLDSLAVLDALATEPAPEGPFYRYASVSQARVRVPAGRYRLLATGADGVRVQVDDRRVINNWPGRQAPRQDAAEVELGELSHGFRVDHYRVGTEDKLWVRLEPLDPQAVATARRLGRRERTQDALLAEADDAVRRDAYHAAAFAARGALHARAGRDARAADDFAAANDIDATDPLWWQCRLALASATGKRATFEQLVKQLALRSFDGKDRHAAARTAMILLIDDRPGTADSRAVQAALSQATTPSPVGGPSPSAGIARALQELRSGRPAEARRIAADSRYDTAPAHHNLLCDLVVALANQAENGGDEDTTAELSRRLDQWARDGRQWDIFETIDWLSARALRAQLK
jgi:serine/threonine protein kinase/tetratricopeptide (TPR) repeat protein